MLLRPVGFAIAVALGPARAPAAIDIRHAINGLEHAVNDYARRRLTPTSQHETRHNLAFPPPSTVCHATRWWSRMPAGAKQVVPEDVWGFRTAGG